MINSEELNKNVICEVDKMINDIVEDGLDPKDVQMLGLLVDIKKDIKKEEYCKMKGESDKMAYRGYGNYNDSGYGDYNEGYGRRSRDSRGRYMARGYRGEEEINNIHDSYMDYNAARDEYNEGNYGAKKDSLEALDFMMKSVVSFLEMIKKDYSSEDEMKIIKKYAHEISEKLNV